MSQQDNAGSEKRSAVRTPIDLKVDYKRLNTFFADYTKNISKGGTFIRTTKPLDVGTEFVFVLSVPTHNTHLELKGEVVWIVTELPLAVLATIVLPLTLDTVSASH